MEFPANSQVFKNQFMSTPLFGLKLFGYIIEPGRKFPYLKGIFFSTCFILFNLSQFLDLATSWRNINELMMNVPTTFLFSTTVVRMVNFYRYHDRYKKLIIEVDQNIRNLENCSTDREKKLYLESVQYARKLLNGFICICLITANTMCLYSLFQSFNYEPLCEPPTILRSWVPTDNVWKYFYLIYTWQLFIMSLGQIIVPCWHAFIVSLMIYVVCSLKILNLQLKLVTKVKGEDGKNDLVTVFKGLIDKHRRVVNFIHELIDLNQCSLFLDFVIFSALRSDDHVQKFICVSYIVTMIVILFLYYWHVNEICIYNYQLSGSIFQSDWYTEGLEFKKMVLFFIKINTPRLKLKAVIVELSLKTFIDILQASYSYFTILNQL